MSPPTPSIILATTKTPDPDHDSVLSRLHAGYFRITLSLSTQTLLWKILCERTPSSSEPLHGILHSLPSNAFSLLLWFLCFATLAFLSSAYLLKCFLHPALMVSEFKHHVGVNYLFAPWVSWLVLLQSAPWLDRKGTLYVTLWWAFAVPLIALDLKVYGQWITTEKRFLSMFANPASQMTIIGNMTAARAAAEMGWRETALFMFSLGMVHYLVVFVTLYQRLSGRRWFPTTLRPVLFLFFAAPSTASLAWSAMTGKFDTPSKMLFFLSLFIFSSLVCSPVLFGESMKRFNVSWWAFSFTLTLLAVASVEYSEETRSSAAAGLMLLLSASSVLIFLCLSMLTIVKLDKHLSTDDHTCSRVLVIRPNEDSCT